MSILKEKGLEFFSPPEVDDRMQKALRTTLRLPIVMFPLVFVRGAYLGSVDRLMCSMATGDFQKLLKANRQKFPSSVPDPLRLLVGPRGQPWYHFQLHVYSNYARAISGLHVILMAIALATASHQPIVAKVAAWIMAVDCLILLVLGPTPLAPLSTLAVVLVWRFRGQAASSWSYKLRFTLYSAVLIMLMLGIEKNVIGGVEKGEDFGTTAKAVFGACMTNALMITVLRF